MTPQHEMQPVKRPTPLRSAAHIWGMIIGAIGAVATAGTSLVAGDTLSADQNAWIAVTVGVITVASAIASAYSTAMYGEADVTPLSSPVNAAGERLVPEVQPPTPMWLPPSS